jgi:hypothetical protein
VKEMGALDDGTGLSFCPCLFSSWTLLFLLILLSLFASFLMDGGLTAWSVGIAILLSNILMYGEPWRWR